MSDDKVYLIRKFHGNWKIGQFVEDSLARLFWNFSGGLGNKKSYWFNANFLGKPTGKLNEL